MMDYPVLATQREGVSVGSADADCCGARLRSPGVRQLDAVPVFDTESFKQGLSRGYQVMGKLMSLVPSIRMVAQYHRYTF